MNLSPIGMPPHSNNQPLKDIHTSMKKIKSFLWAVALAIGGLPLQAQSLYIGANYHPHDDKDVDKIMRDIRLMKEAGFNVTRLGHLAWDSFEPSEGVFDFEWFDEVMDKMAEANIRVILDIATRPAPIWLHQLCPDIDVTDASGNRLYPNHRYMDDVGDPTFQKYALRFVDTLSKRYARHPALLAFGIDNEPGDGPISYSEAVRGRFVKWLERKYDSVGKLNEVWASQRWSRRINRFDEVGLPISGSIQGAPERMLDFRRFISDEVNTFYKQMMDLVNANAPGVLLNTNAWYYSPLKYFDYAPIAYSGQLTRQGCGFYPGPSLITQWGLMNALFGICRIQFESTQPFWCSEFTTATAVPNSIRKSAYASLMYGNQMVCGWTWQSMHGGEEQYLEGMLDWDGIPNRKYEEYKQIASEFKKMAPYFPYQPQAEVGIAYSFDSQMASASFPESHDSQVQTCFNLFYERNMDVRMLDIRRSKLDYKLLLIPGLAVVDEETADKIREYVREGGTVLMTSYSAMVDETGKVFSTTLPGRLSEVFGIRVAGFEETENMNELSPRSYTERKIGISYQDCLIDSESPRFDVIELKGARQLGRIESLHQPYPIVTTHRYGKGRAIYVGLPARGECLSPILEELLTELAIQRGPEVPRGVMARNIDNTHTLYLNLNVTSQTIALRGKAQGILSGDSYENALVLPPYEPELVEFE